MRTLAEYTAELWRHAKKIDTTLTGELADATDLLAVMKMGLNYVQDDIHRAYPRAFWLPRRTWTFAIVSGTHTYNLDKDCVSLEKVTDLTNEADLEIYTIEDFYSLYENPDDDDAGNPSIAVTLGVTTAASYSTGTVYVRHGRTGITGIGTTWTSAHNGKAIRRDGDSVDYTFTFVDATHGTLDREYEGTSSSRRRGADYGIEPIPRLQIRLYPTPDEDLDGQYIGPQRMARLENDGDISNICAVDDNALLAGGLWYMIKYLVPTDEYQIARSRAAYVDARSAIGMMVERTEFNQQIIPYYL